ncbi:MAG: ABC transporter permease [Turicibacter sp.]|nr:ABC transporter permease [Turicibacter sp.]
MKLVSLTKFEWNKYMVYIVFLIVFLIFSVTLGENGFLTNNNLLNILRQTSMISIMAVAGTFVLASGQIDLTVGSVAAMTAMIVALILQHTNSIWLAIIGGLAFGALTGSVNGLLVTRLKLPAFLATLGMMQVIRGAAMWITNTAAVPITNNTFNTIFGIGDLGGVSVLILWTILFYLAGIFVFNKLPFGRHVLATGGNEQSAKYSGINTDWIKMKVFILSGMFAAFAGILYAGRMQSGRFSFGEGDELSVIAAVVLGGAAMKGGSGSVLRTLIGSILMGVITNALILAGLRTAQQVIIQGLILVLAVALSNLAQKNKN